MGKCESKDSEARSWLKQIEISRLFGIIKSDGLVVFSAHADSVLYSKRYIVLLFYCCMVKAMAYTSTVTEKGMITLPADIRRKYSIKKGSKVKIMEEEKGILIMPIPRLEDLFGIDPSMKEVAKAISEGRREEIQHETTE